MSNYTTNDLATTVNQYIKNGWFPLPLPAGQKHPPPLKTTGNVPHLEKAEIENLWNGRPENSNLALRLQTDRDFEIISLDVDHYGNKRGASFLAEMERDLGPLNLREVPRSTRRGVSSPSGQWFFRVPVGYKWKSDACADVDIVQMTHRYAAVFPSVVDGDQYTWYLGDEKIDIPAVEDLPVLPEAWQDFLKKGSAVLRDRSGVQALDLTKAMKWLENYAPEADAEIPAYFQKRLDRLDWQARARHDVMNDAVCEFVKAAVMDGHAGIGAALQALYGAFIEALDGDRLEEAAKEFEKSLTGAVALVSDDLEAGARSIAEVTDGIDWAELNESLKGLGLSRIDESAIAHEFGVPVEKTKETAPARSDRSESAGYGVEKTYGKVRFSNLKNAVIRSAEWVWGGENEGGIPVGGLTIVTGKPGDGKSTMCRWLASEITHGTLDGTWKGTPHSVLYLSAEESQDHMVTPSLIANGAVMSRVHVIVDSFDPAHDMREVISFCRDNDVRAVFVDPLSSYMGGTDSHRNTDVREALKPWSRLAEEIDGAVIAIVHQKKSSGSDFVSGINGSSAYGEVARAVFATAVDAESGTRVVSQGKNSLGPLMPSREYALAVKMLKTEDGKSKTSPKFVLGSESDISAGEIFNRNKKVDSGETETAKSWLRDYLKADPGAFKSEVADKARGLYSVSAIEKAAKELGVETETVNRKARWYLPAR